MIQIYEGQLHKYVVFRCDSISRVDFVLLLQKVCEDIGVDEGCEDLGGDDDCG